MLIVEELSSLLNQPLNPNRQNQLVKCPIHDDRVASLSINLQKGAWYCWGCGKGGGLQTLAQFLGGNLDRMDLIVGTVSEEPEPEQVDFREMYESFPELKPYTTTAVAYQQKKGLHFETLQEFSIRHDGRGNLVMPYFDGDRVVALRYRGNSAKFYET